MMVYCIIKIAFTYISYKQYLYSLSEFQFQIQGGAIQANINIREKPKFDASLQINQAYRITGFGFQPAKKWMQTLPHSLSLVFGNNIDIQPIANIGFLNHYFRFTQYKDLYSKVDQKEGLLTGTLPTYTYNTSTI